MKNRILAALSFLLVFSFVSVSNAKNIQSKASRIDPENCKMCHEDRAKTIGATGMNKLDCQTCHGNGSLHADAAGDKSNPGYATIVNPKKQTPEEISNSCLQCHKEGRLYWKTGVHANKKLSCINCHEVHPKDPAKVNKSLLIKQNQTETCFMCHKDKIAAVNKSSHMPIKEGKMSCASCHDPHGTAAPKNLKSATVNELCFSCHNEKKGPFLWEHPPAADNCLNCHDAHGSIQNKVLIAKTPNVLCQRCHIGTSHPATIWDNYQVTTEATRAVNRSCINCHPNIHGSNSPSGKRFFR